MPADRWHPRGTPTWPNWKKAAPGTRVEMIGTGRQGTFVKASRNRHNGAIIDWDPTPFSGGKVVRGYVVAAAFDLRPL